jgi:hypothetical protein
MRRPPRFALVVSAALLVIAGSYTAYWFIVAGQISESVITWAEAARADKIDVSWQKIEVTGYPIAFRVEVEAAALRDNALTPPPELRVPKLAGSAHPWDFADWWLTAHDGFSADVAGTGDRAPAKLTARTTEGVVSILPGGGWKLWLRLGDGVVDAAAPVQISSADAWISAPPPGQNTDPKTAVAVSARQVTLPAAIGPLGNTIDALDFGATMKGAIPGGKLADAAAAWRDAGGTIALDNLNLKWGALDATASGRIALDQELQPVGGLSGAFRGYDQILTALVAGGQVRASDAGLARIALSLLANAGPNGKPEVRTAFTIQNGQMFLGPAKLGKAPRLTWE